MSSTTPGGESSPVEHPVISEPDATAESVPVASPPRARRRPRVATIVLSALLAVALIGGGVAAAWLFVQLEAARTTIDDQRREIEEQNELIDEKEQFGAAMGRLYESIDPLLGLPYSVLVPWGAYDVLADHAWAHRRDADAVRRDTARVDEHTAELEARKQSARERVAANTTGTAWETTLDQLGSGWVSTSIAPASTICGADVLACVLDTEPFAVHVIGDDPGDDAMTDWIRTGVAYHEYAHVLQNTNPDQTEDALTAFGGDYETMADCYALTLLDGWSLDHKVWIDRYSWWEVSVGYGYTCDESQRQVIREWLSTLGLQKQTVGG